MKLNSQNSKPFQLLDTPFNTCLLAFAALVLAGISAAIITMPMGVHTRVGFELKKNGRVHTSC